MHRDTTNYRFSCITLKPHVPRPNARDQNHYTINRKLRAGVASVDVCLVYTYRRRTAPHYADMHNAFTTGIEADIKLYTFIHRVYSKLCCRRLRFEYSFS